MTPEQINIKIAEACGWTVHQKSRPASGNPPSDILWRQIPNYHGDLNAMHEAERFIIYRVGHGSDLAHYYRSNLVNVADVGWSMSATAPQRAEALLRTLGLWEESK